jgi:hypothetical protein
MPCLHLQHLLNVLVQIANKMGFLYKKKNRLTSFDFATVLCHLVTELASQLELAAILYLSDLGKQSWRSV